MTNTPSQPTGERPGASPGEIQWLERIRQQLEGAAPPFDHECNWQRVAARIDAEREWDRAQNRRSHERRPWWWALMAYGMGAATAAILMTVIAPEPWRADTAVVPLGAEESTAKAAARVRLQVVFSDQATLAQVRAALSPIDAEIVAGPGRLGVWTIAVPASSADEAEKVLRALPIVESVSQ
jgi:hypothetical protein